MDNQESCQANEDEVNTSPKVYKFRWFLAVLVGLVVLILRMIMTSFGIVNDVYVAYFNLTYAEVDWFSLIQLPGDISSSFVLAFFIFLNRTGFRNQLLLMTGIEVFSCICLICSYVYPILYPLIYVSQFSMGIA